MANPLTLSVYVNDELKTVSVPDDTEPLLYVLRNQVGTRGVKYGCGVAQCGACTVVVDGVTKRSCITPLNTVANGAHVETLEGLGQPNNPRGMQKAFIDNQAAQCAYCTSGIIMGSYNWLRGRFGAGNASVPTDDEVKDFLSGVGQTPPFVYLCRCGTHMRIVRAIQQAAKEMK
jgi:aerobic-type carbon monoxide dehydrogenase small subunit (CoxS/CutS family)